MQRPTMTIQGHIITPSPSAKFLGVHIDQGLKWKEHGAATIGRGTGWLAQYKRIAKPASGVIHRYMCQLYFSIALPRMCMQLTSFSHHTSDKFQHGQLEA
ncbi:hypothetical protein CPB83DRAFT_778462 [Crepidotus variabilis]|uniref:Uncharacterized protein n=1 Tax=Crepidotus variabilis TaxID=179855 RepID=A0A9P6JHY7_9AGAR|nr:hypothetical protein CPB83DRAFT_778462 [Crepidotus variabilis]